MLRSLSPTLPSSQMEKDAETVSDSSDIATRGGRREAEKKRRVGWRENTIQDGLKAFQLWVLTNYIHRFDKSGEVCP